MRGIIVFVKCVSLASVCVCVFQAPFKMVMTVMLPRQLIDRCSAKYKINIIKI